MSKGIRLGKPTLRTTNHFLSVVVILAALYIMLWPFLPQLAWWAKHDAPLVSSPTTNTVGAEPIPTENTLVIPKIDFRRPILEGQSVATADAGIWRRPQTSTPPDPSNTVIVGHRFTYQGQSFFYHLDKLVVGDSIVVYWEGKTYHYKVAVVKVVPATDASVEAASNQQLLTLYTCTPLWSAKDRLVVQALPNEDMHQ